MVTRAFTTVRLRREAPVVTTDRPAVLGLAAGLVLPLLAALLYRTYAISITPPWLEWTRQLGYPWLAGELTLVLVALRRGFTLSGTWRMLPRWARVCLALFLATFWISSAQQSPQPVLSLFFCLDWLVQLVFAGALYHIVRQVSPRQVVALWPGFAAGLAVLAILTAIHFAWLPETLHGKERTIDWAIAVPGFISVRLFGGWAGAVLALLVGVAWRSDGDARATRWLPLAAALAFGLVLWTTTRGALLACAVVLPIAWLLAGPPRAVARALPLYLAAAALIILLLPLQPYGDRAYTFFEPANIGSADQIASGRLTIWSRALAAAWQHPWLGNGAGSCWWLVTIDGSYQHHVQPHNALIQFLLEWGIVPTLPALALLLGATWRAHRAARRRPDLLPAILMLDALLLMSMVDGMLHFAQFVMLVVGCLTICLAGERRDTESAHDSTNTHATAAS